MTRAMWLVVVECVQVYINLDTFTTTSVRFMTRAVWTVVVECVQVYINLDTFHGS
jgi:hypothetical protein